MADKTEAQPEALRLAEFFESLTKSSHRWWDGVPVHEKAAAVLRAQAAEIEQLKALNDRLQPTIEDDSQEWAKCDPAIAFHLIERHSDNWADAGKMMTEFAEAKAEVKLKALRDELTVQTNRAAAAEQQVTALTQRLDMANRLNTDAREQLADIKPERDFYKHRCDALQAAQSTMRDPERTVVCDILANGHLLQDGTGKLDATRYAQLSARQAAPDGWRIALERIADPRNKHFAGDAQIVARDALSAAPPPPEREPLSDEQIEKLRKNTFSTDNPFCPCDRKTMQKAVRAAERAHGIGATND